MKRFREFINEDPKALHTERGEGVVDVDSQDVREGINALLAQATACPSLTPYIAFLRVSKVLASFHIHLPQTMLAGERGLKVFDINQFGLKTGMNNDGKVMTAHPSEYKIYFEYDLNDRGVYDIYCEIVTKAEIAEIENDIELEEETMLEALSSFGRAYRNARMGNQGTFNWRGKSYDSELKTRPVNRPASTASKLPSTAPVPRPNPVRQRDNVEKAVFGTPDDTSKSTVASPATAGPKSTVAQPDSGAKSTVADKPVDMTAAASQALRARQRSVPSDVNTVLPNRNITGGASSRGDTNKFGSADALLPKPQPQPSVNLKRPAPKVPEASLDLPSDAKPAAQAAPTPEPTPEPAKAAPPPPPKPAPSPNLNTTGSAPTNGGSTKFQDRVPSTVPPSPQMDRETEKVKAAQKADVTAGSRRIDEAQMLSETDSKFTRMLKQRRG